jgi:membrane associated rhomboid family serine protease
MGDDGRKRPGGGRFMREYRDYLQPDEAKTPFWLGLSSVTQVLILVNAAVFLVFVLGIFVVLPYGFGYGPPQRVSQQVLDYVGLIPQLAIGKFWLWQLFSYSFLHSYETPLHLVFNMVTLYFFGREVETLYGPKRFLTLYFVAGFVAAICYCAGSYGAARPLIGASGAIYAVMVTYAFHYPRQRILFFFLIPLEVWIVVTILIGVDLTMLITGQNTGVGYLAHLGGAAFGFIFYRYQDRLDAYLERVERRIQKSEREHDEEIEARLDTLLEKISKDGISSLSRKERDFLKRASRHYQKKS